MPDLLTVCESWLGTPFRHLACRRGPDGGVDCIHFVAAALVEAGRLPESLLAEIPAYPRDWHLHSDDDRLAAGLISRPEYFLVHSGDAADGDVAAYQFGRCSSHSALRVGDHLYHAVVGHGVIRSAAADEFWVSRFRAAFIPIWSAQ